MTLYAAKHRVEDVFTPTTPARLTFVERVRVNDRLVNALRTPGKQVIVYGHSGSGKTTLLVNKLHQIYEHHVTTRCVGGLSLDQLVLDAFDQLGPYYISERSSAKESSATAGLKAGYAGIQSQLKVSATSSETMTRVLPPQLTPQFLARLIGAANACWVLEDFHKIDVSEKQRLGQIMKVFMDMADEYRQLRVVAIGAVDTAREVVQYEPEMKNRIAEIHVPLMTPAETSSIVDKGEERLKISIGTDIRKGIVRYSNGLASVCHHLCLFSAIEKWTGCAR
jgi:energy-coupling factor transporter ATP-binding protein EcfA2